MVGGRLLVNKWFHPVVVLILTGLVFLIYSNTFHSGFHFDDKPQILENRKIQSIESPFSIITGHRGVTMATFALNYAIGGFDVVGYHIFNVLIHILNAVLVYFFIYHTFMLAKDDELLSRKIAFCSALFFAVHPLQIQSVTYIVQRMESLSVFFYLASLLLFIKGVKSSSETKRIFFYSGVSIAFLLGFYSKEIAITIPAIIFLYDFYFISEGKVKEVLKRWPLYAGLLVFLAFFIGKTIVPIGGFGDVSEASVGFGLKSISAREYLLTQFNVLLYYIILILVPVNQNIDYDFPVSKGLFEVPRVEAGTVLNVPLIPPVISLVILVVILFSAFFLYRKSVFQEKPLYRAASFFILWFFVILFPTSSFIPIKDVIFEHRVYMPSVGVFILINILLFYGVDRIKGRLKAVEWVVVIAVVGVVAVLSGATYARNKVWKDNVSLWEDVVAKSPNKPRAFYNLGNAYRDINLLSAKKAWEKAVEIAPNYSPALNQLGNIYHMSGSLKKARDYFERAVRAYHKNAEAHYNLAMTLEKLNETEEAYRHYEMFLETALPEYEFLFPDVKRKLLGKKAGE